MSRNAQRDKFAIDVSCGLVKKPSVASNEISKTQTIVSANGLTTTVDSAFTSTSLTNGTWDQITTDKTTVNGDGSLNETLTTTDGSGHVLETVQKNLDGLVQAIERRYPKPQVER